MLRFFSSIRAKFTLSLLVVSLTAALLVGGIARWMLMSELGQMEAEERFARYCLAMEAYAAAYGSLEKAMQAESFPQFQQRTEHLRFALPEGEMPTPQPEPSPSFAAPPPSRMPPPQMPPQMPGGFAGGGPPPPGGGPGMRGMPPPPAPLPMRPNPPAAGSTMPGPPLSEMESHYRFLTLDISGRPLMGDPEYVSGRKTLTAAQRKAGRPLFVKGKLAGRAIPVKKASAARLDAAYLAAINTALLYATGAAFLLAMTLGIALGSRLSGNIRRLKDALDAMQEGRLRQVVVVKANDEIGALASTFNKLSAELDRSHKELAQSNAELARSMEQVREQAKRLEEMSIRDPLTGLFNRRHFDEQARLQFAQANRYHQPMTVMIGDLDLFKQINDRFSHAVGDAVLREVAALLQADLRESDVAARYGGEEFVIAFYGVSAAQAETVCERIRQRIEEFPWHTIHPELHVTISMGISDEMYRGSFEKMLAAADACLYEAKQSGRNRICASRSRLLTAPVVLS